jgi:trimeric autotransporter adhesin
MKMKRFLHLVVLGLALQQAQAQSWLTNGLVAYYPFNGNANNERTNGYHGQITGTVVAAPDRFGNANRAYRFNHTNYGSIYVNGPVFNLGQAEYTITGWFCSDDVTLLYQNIINTIPHPGFMVELNNEVVPGRLELSTGTGSSWTDLYLTGAKTDFTNRVWYQMALAKVGTNYTVYINGQIDGQHAVAAAAGYNNNVGYRFGAINTGSWNWQGFHGRLDDFRIYSRALSASEVAQLYAIEYPPVVSYVKAFTIDYANLVIGLNYQAQVSSDLIVWTNWGAPFTATSTTYTNTSYQRIADWNQQYFRLLQQ